MFAQEGAVFTAGQIIAIVTAVLVTMAGAISTIFGLLIRANRDALDRQEDTLKRVRADRDDYKSIGLDAIHVIRFLEHQLAILQGKMPTTTPLPPTEEPEHPAETKAAMRQAVVAAATRSGVPPRQEADND